MENTIQVLVWIAIYGLVVWAIQRVVPMTEPIRNLYNVVALIAIILFVLHAFGLFSGLPNP